MMSKNEDYPLVQAFINALNAKSQDEIEKQAEIMHDLVFRDAIAEETTMKQTDRDHISTRQLNRLRCRILRVYGTARREMQKQLIDFLEKYRALDERKRAQLDAGEITEDDYRIWLQNQSFSPI